MSVDGIGTTSAVGFANFSAMSGSLTPDAMLEYAQTQLGSIDNSINQLMNDQNSSAKATATLSDVANELQGHPDGFQTANIPPGENPGAETLSQQDSSTLNSDVVSKLTSALQDTTDPTIKQEIQGMLDKWNNTMGDGNVSQTEMGQFLDQIKDAQSDMSSNQQMAMIQIQSLVSQRQQAIQMTSSIMQTLNDSTKGVITNINQ